MHTCMRTRTSAQPHTRTHTNTQQQGAGLGMGWGRGGGGGGLVWVRGQARQPRHAGHLEHNNPGVHPVMGGGGVEHWQQRQRQRGRRPTQQQSPTHANTKDVHPHRGHARRHASKRRARTGHSSSTQYSSWVMSRVSRSLPPSSKGRTWRKEHGTSSHVWRGAGGREGGLEIAHQGAPPTQHYAHTHEWSSHTRERSSHTHE